MKIIHIGLFVAFALVAVYAPAAEIHTKKQLQAMTQDELVDLVLDLQLQYVQALQSGDNETQNNQPDQSEEIARLKRQVASLRTALQAQRARSIEIEEREKLERRTERETATAVIEEPDAESITTQASAAPFTYGFQWEWGLISETGEGRMTVRVDGDKEKIKYDYEEYRNDAIWVTATITNTTARPLRFQGTLAVAGPVSGFMKKSVEVLATTTATTRTLQPGESQRLTYELDVRDPKMVRGIELGNVRAFDSQ